MSASWIDARPRSETQRSSSVSITCKPATEMPRRMRALPGQAADIARLVHQPVHTGHCTSLAAPRAGAPYRVPLVLSAQRSSRARTGAVISSVETARATRCAPSAITTTSPNEGTSSVVRLLILTSVSPTARSNELPVDTRPTVGAPVRWPRLRHSDHPLPVQARLTPQNGRRAQDVNGGAQPSVHRARLLRGEARESAGA